jgi:hypothetical protein
MAGAPGIGAHHRERVVAPGARHCELDVAQIGQQVTRVRPVAPVGRVASPHRSQMAVDRGIHASRQDRLEGITRRPAVVLAPVDPLRLHSLHHSERSRWRRRDGRRRVVPLPAVIVYC